MAIKLHSSIAVKHSGLFFLMVFAVALASLRLTHAAKLGGCDSGVYTPEVPQECTSKVFCQDCGCQSVTGWVASPCKSGFAIVTLNIAAADRIKTETYSESPNNA